MNILIIGTGVVGAMYGWAFSEASQAVTHLVRPGRKQQLKGGIDLDVFDNRKGHKKNTVTQHALKCVEAISPSEPYELIILPIHFHQMEAALKSLAPVARDALFLGFGSNWHGAEVMDRYLPRERYLLGFPYSGGMIQNGKYVVNLGTKVYLGEVDGSHSEKLERVKALFAQCDQHVDVPDNILHLLWTCHSTAVGLSAGVARAGGVTSFLHDKASMTHGYHAVRELFELCCLRGGDPYKYPDQALLFKVPAWLFVTVFQWFSSYNAGIPRILARLAEPAGDTRELYREMMNTARELNFNMPYMKAASPYLQVAE